MTNPIIISILLGMPASLCQIRFSFVIDKTLDSMSALATPLALLGLGAGFEDRKVLKQIKPTLVCSAIKLLIQPMLFLPLAAWMGFRDEKMVAILIMLGAPTTVSCYIMAVCLALHGADLASKNSKSSEAISPEAFLPKPHLQVNPLP